MESSYRLGEVANIYEILNNWGIFLSKTDKSYFNKNAERHMDSCHTRQVSISNSHNFRHYSISYSLDVSQVHPSRLVEVGTNWEEELEFVQY